MFYRFVWAAVEIFTVLVSIHSILNGDFWKCCDPDSEKSIDWIFEFDFENDQYFDGKLTTIVTYFFTSAVR